MVVRDDSALLTQLRIETANNLVTIQIEVKPLLAARAFQTSEDLLVEAPSFSDISDLHGYLKAQISAGAPSLAFQAVCFSCDRLRSG